MTTKTTIRRMQGLTIEEHILTVPLVWDDPSDTRTIDVFAAVVASEGGEDLPYLLFLQGGPGHEAPRAFQNSSSPAWLDAALKEHRVVLLDQRGTGRSTPVGDRDLERGSDAVAEHLTHLRADSIVRDAEAVRRTARHHVHRPMPACLGDGLACPVAAFQVVGALSGLQQVERQQAELCRGATLHE